jgi:hypothetical protein
MCVLQVSSADDLPKSVCKKCCDQLVKFDRFADNALQMQGKLHGLALKPAVEVEEEEPESLNLESENDAESAYQESTKKVT